MSPPTPQTLNAAKQIPKATLAGDLNPIFEAVGHGVTVVDEAKDGPRVANVDVVDLRILRAMSAYYAGPPALDLEAGAHPPTILPARQEAVPDGRVLSRAASTPNPLPPEQDASVAQVLARKRLECSRSNVWRASRQPIEAPKVMKTVKMCPREARVR